MRKQFTFYRSYWEAINKLPKMSQLALYRAICEYALNETVPELSGAAASAFILICPTLDRAKRQSDGAKRANELIAARTATGESAADPIPDDNPFVNAFVRIHGRLPDA